MKNSALSSLLISGRELSRGIVPRVDMHMHSAWSDGRSTVAELLTAAEQAKLDAVIISDHVNFSTDWFPSFIAELRELRSRSMRVQAFIGAEVTAADYQGALKADGNVLSQAEVVIGVIHSYPKSEGGVWRFDELNAEDALELEIRALIGLTENPNVDIIGHPGGTYRSKYGPFPIEKLEPVVTRAKAMGKAIEINGRHCWDIEGMVELLARIDPLVTLGSDVHDVAEVGLTMRLLASMNQPDRFCKKGN